MAKILLIPASLSKSSLNLKLLGVCAAALEKLGHSVERVEQNALNVSLINTDIPEAQFPESIKKIALQIKNSDAVVIATPEYNGSISPILKNFVDWTSTLRPHPWAKKPLLLVGTSPGHFGAVQGLLHSRVPFDRLGAIVYPQSYALPYGDKELEGHKIKDEKKQKALEDTLLNFLSSSIPASR